MMYLARCNKGKVIAGAIANTPLEQAEAASEVKKWIKKGYTVTLEEPETPPVWCLDDIPCYKCKLEDVNNGNL